MSEDKKISIITVSYNAASTIEQTIYSVVNQSYENIEFIIIDGGSADGTVEIIQKYADKIAYWVSEPDKGIYDAMNKGITAATGEYIYFLGSDDVLVDEQVMERVANQLDSEVDVLSATVWSVFDNALQMSFENNTEYSKEEDIVRRNIRSPHQGMFVKTSIMKQLKFDTKYKIGADYKLLLTLWYGDYKVKKIPDKIAFYSAGGISNQQAEKGRREYLQVLQDLGLADTEYSRAFATPGTKSKITSGVKCLLDKMGLLSVLRLKQGWVRHKCGWKDCRWCK